MARFSIGHPALDSALSLAAQAMPQSAERAAIALKYLLQDVTASAWPEVAWQFSSLTGDGFPVEFAFTTAEKETLRYTTEISGPENAPSRKLAIAQQTLSELGAVAIPDKLNRQLSQIQSAGALQYGVWVGGRHDAKGDRYKLYAEVPTHLTLTDLNKIVPDWIEPTSLLPRETSLRMIGYELSTGRMEFYYRVAGLAVWEVNQLLQRLGLDNAQTQWAKFIAEIYPYSLTSAIPGSNVGFSLSVLQEKVQSVALFTFARSLFGGDRAIRQHLLKLSAQYEWPMSAYEKLSSPLLKRTGCNTAHGMVTFAIAPNRFPVVGIGLRPQEVCDDIA
ncbi:MAG: hypothetical protein AAFR18_16185 [Cyanobacteria bacterium J06627_32]